jgi:hypothetical protein
MRNLYLLDAYRVTDPRTLAHWGGWAGDDTCGMFVVRSPIDGGDLKVVASAGEGWDHVSVSRPNRCPNWPEMEHVKRLFFRDDETAMQLHVPPSDHVNMHRYCLHLWRPLDCGIPRPPSILVGVGAEPAKDVAEAMVRTRDALTAANGLRAPKPQNPAA